jgi:uncharacterized protein YfiM (DUF2279 family)
MKVSIILLLLFFLSFQALQAKPIISKDHVLHFSGSAFLTYWNYEFSGDFFNYNHQQQIIYSVNITALLGFAKESSDKYIKTTKFSWKDMTVNVLGIATSVIIIESIRNN